MTQSYFPILIVITPNNPTQGQTVTITVTLNMAPTYDQAVNISGSVSNFFTNLPSSVTVQANSVSTQFEATVSDTAAGIDTVTASANGGSASTSVSPPSQ